MAALGGAMAKVGFGFASKLAKIAKDKMGIEEEGKKGEGLGLFAVGDMVKIKLKGWSSYYDGCISSVYAEEPKYDVKLDDGECQMGVRHSMCIYLYSYIVI